jgi:hypothetical protein
MKLGKLPEMATKTNRLLIIVIALWAAVIPRSSISGQPDADPTLVFKGYGLGATNTSQVAKFEFHNRSSKTLRLSYEGAESPLSAPFLTRFTAPAKPNNTNSNWSATATLGSWFEEERQLPPGQRLLLNFPLVPGKPAAEVGIVYYVDAAERTNRYEASCLHAVSYQANTTNTAPGFLEPPAGGSK